MFQVLSVLCFTRPRYQVSVYRTIGSLVTICVHMVLEYLDSACIGEFNVYHSFYCLYLVGCIHNVVTLNICIE